jgi:hypothetical protein
MVIPANAASGTERGAGAPRVERARGSVGSVPNRCSREGRYSPGNKNDDCGFASAVETFILRGAS